MSGQLQDLANLPSWKECRYPFNSRLGSPQTQSGSFGEEYNICPYQNSNPGLSGS